MKKRLLQLPRLASLGALSMAELGGLKKPLEDLLSVIPDDSSFDEGISIAYQVAVDFLREQIERGETTKNLDIEAMRETSAAVLIPRILELRRKEVESLILGPDKNGVYHIGDLYRTYYGRLLSAKFGLSLRVKLSELEPLLAAMDGLGLKLRVLSEPEEE
ncbi:MAG: hypothetical protein DRO87_08390 [Candidatus Thorarchaeota archaeon]|nr:MAG: hypothetical protein DRP09_14695 [Candidatus Thorarchaeota archaeon]RLI56011.1 MAG: hypothetical protein DRO87_08390 [Candidatus Thorarchaeota archaeon]